MPPIVRARASVVVPRPAAQLWPLIADTNRIDHAVGLPEGSFSFRRREEGGETVTGEYRLAGRAWARWTEHPFEWEQPHHYAIRRDFALGPWMSYRGEVALAPAAAGGTRVTVTTTVLPRHWPAWLALRWLLAPATARRAAQVYARIGDFLAGRRAEPFPALAPGRGDVDGDRLAVLAARLRAGGAAVGLVERLRRLLAEAADEDVAGMRPLEWAARWGVDGRATLNVFLAATVEGLVELRWELLCPGCRGVKATAEHLRTLAAGGFCPACNRHIIASRDEAIEARFYPAPTVRRAEVGAYCVGSPALTPHRLAQADLAPGETRRWRLTLAPGRYLVSSPQSRDLAEVTAGDGLAPQPPTPGGLIGHVPQEQGVSVPVPPELMGFRGAAGAAPPALAVTPETIAPATIRLAAGVVEVVVTNAGPHRATVALDDAAWSETGATPSRLLTLPAFHSLFSDEALAPGVELAVGRVGLLFTDLAGSTALYERAGEARAFRLVSEHFGLLRGPIEAAGGAIVKTIGDAIMAAFPDGRAALTAALAMQRAMGALDTGGLADPTHLLKIGVHAGACYLVTANDRLDYFGTAVNLAARAQHEAGGGEIVITAAVHDEAAELAGQAGLAVTPFEARVRGLATPVHLYRID